MENTYSLLYFDIYTNIKYFESEINKIFQQVSKDLYSAVNHFLHKYLFSDTDKNFKIIL